MGKKIFIGITGVKESGKTTAFEAIQEVFPEATEITLAKPLKDACAEVLSIPRDHFDNQKFKEVPLDEPVYLSQSLVEGLFSFFKIADYDYDTHIRPHIGKVIHSPREAAQYVGTEVLRTYDPDIHCKAATLFVPESEVYVVTDMRFWNEYDYFAQNKEFDFEGYYIKNPIAEAKLGPNPHASEKYVLEIGKKCTLVTNDGINLLPYQSLVQNLFKQTLQNKGFNHE